MDPKNMEEAFAHVLFHALWNKFKVPSEENYTLEDVEFELDEDIVKAIVSLQLCYRRKLEVAFVENPGLTIDGAKFFSFVDKCLDSFASLEAPFHRMLGSFGIFAEFALFKYTEGNKQSLDLAPQFWPKYFNDRLKKYFDDGGGLEKLKAKAVSVNNAMGGLDKYLYFLKQPYDFSELAGLNEILQEYRTAVLSSLEEYGTLVSAVEEARVPDLPVLPTSSLPESSTSSPTSCKPGGTGGARSKVRRPRHTAVETKLSEEVEMSPRKTSKRTVKSSPIDEKAVVSATEEFAEPSTTTTRVTRSSARRKAEVSQVTKSESSLQTKGVLQVPEQTRLTRLVEKLESSHLQHPQLQTDVSSTACDEPEGEDSSEVTESAVKESTRKTGKGSGKGRKGSRKSKKK